MPAKTLVVLLVSSAVLGCGSAVAPAKPTLVSVTGHLVPGACLHRDSNGFAVCSPVPNAYTFNFPAGNKYFVESQVRFTVPYPTDIELSIDGKPLKQVQVGVGDYEYFGVIENAANPATWMVKIRSPDHTPIWSFPGAAVPYKLSIVNVSGTQRSAPLEIVYYSPAPDPGPMIITGTTTTSYKPETPSSSSGSSSSCPEQEYTFCFSKSGFSKRPIAVTACSSQQALNMLSGQYGDWSHTSGPC